jgi:hypothetical protein
MERPSDSPLQCSLSFTVPGRKAIPVSEIKSTLDLIMERTKHLTLNEEEKKMYKGKELEGKVKGLVQRVLDGLVNWERFGEEKGVLQREGGDEEVVKRLFRDELTGRIQLGENNDSLMNMLEKVIGADPEAVRRILCKYDRNATLLRNSHEKSLRERLRGKGISGPAAVPNLEADQEWRQALQDLRKDLKEELKTELA